MRPLRASGRYSGLLLVLMLGACATTPPCDPTAQVSALLVSATALPAAPAGCDPIAFEAAWNSAVTDACSPQQAWSRALTGHAALPVCPIEGGALWAEAHHLGLQYRKLENRLREVTGADADGAPVPGVAGLEQVRLERELNSIRGAAQVRGWWQPDRR